MASTNHALHNRWIEFKIGITCDPRHRWRNCEYGYERDGWKQMHLLYAAPTSKKHDAESTGTMEKYLISWFLGCEGCLNRGLGGEKASDGSPHFTYVVVR